MTSRWKTGMWIGKEWSSDEHMIATDKGHVVRSRSVKACPEKPTLEQVLKIRITVAGVQPNQDQIGEARDEPLDVSVGRERTSSNQSVLLRNWRVSKPMVEAFGYTPGCGRCDMMQGKPLRVPDHGHRHSTECRSRVEAEARKDPRFAGRMQDAEQEVMRAQESMNQQGEKESAATGSADAPVRESSPNSVLEGEVEMHEDHGEGDVDMTGESEEPPTKQRRLAALTVYEPCGIVNKPRLR